MRSLLKRILLGAMRSHGQRRMMFSEQVSRAANWYVLAYNNVDYNSARNGEMALLRRLSALDLRTVFDVGANQGEWSLLALESLPSATVHSFEIAAPTYTKLINTLAGNVRSVANGFGLSNEAGNVLLSYYPGNDAVTSMVLSGEIHDAQEKKTLPARVEVGDVYCQLHGIAEIDYLKVDVEGAEEKVLQGFEGMLGEGAVKIIQFEYGMGNIYSKFLLKDIYGRFERFGYEVGKIMPKSVEFRPYDPREEDFRGPNYVAVRRGLRAERKALAGER